MVQLVAKPKLVNCHPAIVHQCLKQVAKETLITLGKQEFFVGYIQMLERKLKLSLSQLMKPLLGF